MKTEPQAQAERAITPLELSELKRLTLVAQLEPQLRDPRPQARELIAQRLGEIGTPDAVAPLGQLVLDRQAAVAARAIAALGGFEDPTARQALEGALAQRGDRDQDELLQLLRDQGGSSALLTFLRYLPEDEKQAWERQDDVFSHVGKLADPRAAPALLGYLDKNPHPHFRVRAAYALASIGDIRAVPHLAWRLRQDPQQLYFHDHEWEVELREYHKLEDHERNTAARLIADVAQMNPKRKLALQADAEDALLLWLDATGSQHAEGMRALTEIGSEKGRALMRQWVRLKSRPQASRGDFVAAGTALRYLGRLRDEQSRALLLEALRPQAQHQELSMGAAQGLSEWGDPRGVEPLLGVIRDPKRSQPVRLEACRALLWVAGEEAGALVLEELGRHQGTDERQQRIRKCLLTGLSERPVGLDEKALLRLLAEETPADERRIVSFALGRRGFGTDSEQVLLELARSSSLATEATIALMFGGKTATAKHALSVLSAADRKQVHYVWTQGYRSLSTEDVSKGLLFRLVEIAATLENVEIDGEMQRWARMDLLMGLHHLQYGPHSVRPAVLRKHLFDLAKTRRAWKPEATLGRSAARALDYFVPDGPLMALLELEHVDHDFVRLLLSEPWDPRTRRRLPAP